MKTSVTLDSIMKKYIATILLLTSLISARAIIHHSAKFRWQPMDDVVELDKWRDD